MSKKEERKRYRKGSLFEVTNRYCFIPSGSKTGEMVCMERGSVGQVSSVYPNDDPEFYDTYIMQFKNKKDGKKHWDTTDIRFTKGKLRRLNPSEKKSDKKKKDWFKR